MLSLPSRVQPEVCVYTTSEHFDADPDVMSTRGENLNVGRGFFKHASLVRAFCIDARRISIWIDIPYKTASMSSVQVEASHPEMMRPLRTIGNTFMDSNMLVIRLPSPSDTKNAMPESV